MKLGLCFGCLLRRHTSTTCPQRKICGICNGRHPTAFHKRKSQEKNAEGVVSLHARSTSVPVHGCNLHVVPILVTLGTRTVRTNAFLDSGSTHSFCSNSLLNKLNCNTKEITTMNLTTVQNQARLPSHVIRGIVIKDLNENNGLSMPPLLTLDKIPVGQHDIQIKFDRFQYLLDNGVEIPEIEGDVELLLGNNAALAMEPLQVVNSKNGGPFAVKTRYGWILISGGNIIDPNVNSIWATEECEKINEIMATEDKGPSAEDGMWCVQVDASCSRTEEGNFQISLPVRRKNLSFPNNRTMAFRGMEAIKKKCINNGKLCEDYTTQMDDLISNSDLDSQPEEYRMMSHTFGATSPPSCTNYALRQTAVEFDNNFGPDVIKTFFDHFYVDGSLKFVATEEKAIQILKALQHLCAMGGFHFTKVISNSKKVLRVVPSADRSKQVKTLDFEKEYLPPERALGIFWHVEEDSFGFDVDMSRLSTMPRTRRRILSAVTSAYGLQDGPRGARHSVFNAPCCNVLKP